MKSSHSTVGALTGIARQQISSNISSLISIRGWCEGFGEDWMSKSPLPHCCHPPSQGQCSRWLIIVLTLPSERSGPSASLPPQNTPHRAARRNLHPKGRRDSEKWYEPNDKNQYLVRPRGDYWFFSHDIHVSCTSCFSGALETQVPPRPRVARLWLRNICTSQEVHVWSLRPMSPTWVAAGTCWHKGYWVSWEEVGQQETPRATSLGQWGEYHMEMLCPLYCLSRF